MCSPSTADVRFITFVNTTYIQAENLETVFDILLKIEVGVLVFSWIEFLYLFYLFVFIRAMHFNLTFLFMNYGGQYFFSMLSRCLIVWQQLGNDPDDDLHEVIIIANYLRTIGLFIAMYILPIFMIERCLATFLVKNYEKSRNIWASLLILSIFHPLVFTSAIAYIHCWLPVVFHVISFFIVNIIGYIGIHYCSSYNTKKHQKFYSSKCFSKVSYGLSERFQLAENIKMCNVLKKVQISILFFNIGCCSILLMDHFKIDMMIIYWSYICFNFFCLAYGITVPIILYSALPEWQKETRRLIFLCIGRAHVEEEPKSTFGEQMIYNDATMESNIYFTQFNKTTE
ncbi:hypothetical protein B9Z55_020685 [Caenorhabditis nigoni]|uniref:Uncharacterized protein n=1 Tax=Caenorhabditis nigoni TaxID=1611254 RepID=A0A2G5TPA0_9PELO|nr:hypothetical protein B9Z55_020685 [Caenorhabditis nigoni]